jgi:hypothetical protein
MPTIPKPLISEPVKTNDPAPVIVLLVDGGKGNPKKVSHPVIVPLTVREKNGAAPMFIVFAELISINKFLQLRKPLTVTVTPPVIMASSPATG